MSLRSLAVGAVALTILAGCDSGGGQARPTPAPTPPTEEPAAEPGSEVPPPAPEGGAAVAPAAPQAASGAPAGRAAAGAAADADFQRRKVQYYFDQVDYLLRTPKHGVPAEVADADALLATLRDKSEKVRALEAPGPAGDHQRQVLSLLDGSIALVDRMRALRNTQDPSAKLSFDADRRSLDEQEKQIDTLAAEIKQQVASPPPPPPSQD